MPAVVRPGPLVVRPAPPDEGARLVALDRYAILDTPPEESFERAVRLAAALFDVPIAFISFLDAERQWFKAAVGADLCEAPRRGSFCDPVIRSGAPLVVEDAQVDPRFAHNPFVTGPAGVRFYAGAPLTTPDGHCVGTLCVIGVEAREAPDLAPLRDLAATVVAELELRREVAQRCAAERTLAAEKEQAEHVLEGMGEALFAFDGAGRLTYLNAQAAALAGGGADALVGTTIEDLVPGERGVRLAAACRRAVCEGRPDEFELGSSEGDAWFHVRVCPHARGLTAFVSDATERHRAEETGRRREAILEGAGAAADALRRAADFHFLRGAAWDDELHALLAHLGRSTGAGRAYVIGARPAPGGRGGAVGEWTAPGVEAWAAGARAAAPPGVAAWWAERLGRGETVTVRASEAPEPERRRLASRGSASVVAVPVLAGGEWWGVLGLETGDPARTWAEAEVDALRVVAASLGAAVQRQESRVVLRESEEQLRLLIDGVPDHSIFLIDAGGRIETWNAGAERLKGYTAAEAIGLPYRAFYPPDDVAAGVPDEVLRRAAAEGSATTEGWRVRKDGSRFWVSGTVTALRDEPGADGGPGRLRGFGKVVRDATEEWEAAERLRQDKDRLQERVAERTAALAETSEQLEVEIRQRRHDKRWITQLGTLLDRAQDAIWVLDAESVTAYANRSAQQLYGWGPVEWLGRDIRDLLGAPLDTRHAEAFGTALAEGEWAGELRQRTRAGTDIVVESRWTFVEGEGDDLGSILVVNTDVSERKALLLRARRVEDLGRLAGGIAHDINNVLGPILMSLQLLAMRAGDDDATRKLLGTLESAATRGAGLVRQLLSYMRGARGEWAPVSVVPLVDEVGQILQETLPSNVALDLAVADDLPHVVADPTQLHQVLMNLTINARDAMPGGGALAVAVEDRTVDAAEAERYRDGRVGRFVRVTVSDTGVGMPPDVLDRVFDPFFTTKEGGTGLGLANVVGIVKGHGGFVVVESAEGAGTRFDVFLPAAETSAPPEAAGGGAAEPLADAGGAVLVVDDNEAMRGAACGVLASHGYRPVPAAHGADALDQLDAHGPVCAVLTDMMMPVMDGPALARALNERAPDLPVIGMSGLTTPGEAAAGGARFAGFLPKPFQAGDLLQALDEVLATPPAPSA
ncbi:PAS domain S-box protein [Rubrivirga sp. S365]|uniref:hybrid sensor histidine kinase/response regulator n=1 Tax=Rubrivirga sp. S365 TaxID=3076080 RepID=UPI0028CA7158|nr:PAS domain S-box protein [Rubrivirga sp. S365]MDT7856052.1 PAS domain S-box protein [Rubrivirga sp. S365]